MENKKRPYHHGDLRAALLEAAERTVAAGGMQSLSLRQLSRETGVSYTAPRRHFSNKQALVDALAVSGFERLGAALARAVTDRDRDFDARIIKLARAHIKFATKHPALLRMMFAAKHNASASQELLDASNKALALGPSTIAGGQDAGAVIEGDPNLLALTVFSAVEGLVAISASADFDGVPLDRLVVDVVRQIIVGLRPRP